MKSNDMILLAAVAAGGYLIFKSDIAKNIGQVGSGVGEAVGGLGQGIGEIGTSAGDVAQGFAYGINSVLDLLNPLGAYGNQIAANIEAGGEINKQKIIREGSQEEIIDLGAFEIIQDPLIDIQAKRDLFIAEQEAKRSGMFEENKNQWTGYLTQADDVIVNWAKAGSILPFAGSNVFSWLKSQVSSIKLPSLTDPIIQNVSASNYTAPVETSSTSSLQSTGGGSSSITSTPETISGTFQGLPISVDPVETSSDQSTLSKVGSWFLRTFTFM